MDEVSGNHESKLEKLASALDSLGAKYLPFKIDEFGQIQVYLVFRKAIDVSPVADLLTRWLLLNELDFVRIIPFAEPISFPLQADFAWLSKNARVIVAKSEIHSSAALKMLLDGLTRAEMNSEIFVERLTLAVAGANDNEQLVQELSAQAVEHSPITPMQVTLQKIARRNHWFYDFGHHPTRVIPIENSDIQPITKNGRAPPDYPPSSHKRLH